MTKCKEGRIHSTESFGTVDGPGTRFVIFFQGCPMRCQYCHNPDTWDASAGTTMTVDELLRLYDRNKTFYRNGGLTATGGEPLLQLPFLTELFRKAKEQNIHTCLDTSGITYRESKKEQFQTLFSYTDLVLLDIKHSDPRGHQELTGQAQDAVYAFAKALEEAQVPVIIRHVIVPNVTDQEEELTNLGHFIGTLRNLKGLEVLPYHTMGVNKYRQLGITYPLEGVESLPKEKAVEARNIILKAIRDVRK